MKKRIIVLFLLITMNVSGCSSFASSSMTNIDKEYNKYAIDAAEDEWIEICVRLTAETKSVSSVDCSYWDADTYEETYNATCDASHNSKEGLWYNVNLSKEEIDGFKDAYGVTDLQE